MLQQYIPLQPGQAALVKEQNMISTLFGLTGYEVRDGYVIFTKDLTADNVSKVDMQLVVMDFDKYDEFDILPLTADQAAAVVQETVLLLLQTPTPDKKVDPILTEQPKRK